MKRKATLPVHLLSGKILFAALAMFLSTAALAQFNVTEIVTDYKGYWKSSSSNISNVKPDNSHNLVSFSFNGNRYSTGVNDALLTSKGLSFIAGDFRALPVTTTSGANSSTKIGLGYMYDGVEDGPGTPRPVNNIPYYLTDGIKGLDLGTCVANLPAGTLMLPVSKVLVQSIGDGNPDIVITQVADPSGSLDRYEFTDINGTRVGNYVDIQLSNIPSIGNWTADFYDANTTPMNLSSGYTKTDRPIRLWASDLSSFGINATNASKVAYFRITLSGNSDVAFVAYSSSAINIVNSLLPVDITNFTGKAINQQAQLNWQTVSEINSDAFIVERSNDGNTFNSIGQVSAAGTSSGVKSYSFTDHTPEAGKNYYRLKTVDRDGKTTYSKIITVNIENTVSASLTMYPNPAKNFIVVNHVYAGSNEQLMIVNANGVVLSRTKIVAQSLQTKVDFNLPKGSYQLVWSDGKQTTSSGLMIL